MSDRDKLTEYGFIFGAMEVTRLASLPDGTVVLGIATAHRKCEVYASPGGRSLRVVSGGLDIPLRGKDNKRKAPA